MENYVLVDPNDEIIGQGTSLSAAVDDALKNSRTTLDAIDSGDVVVYQLVGNLTVGFEAG